MDDINLEGLLDILAGLGLDPREDDVQSEVTDYANGCGLDPELVYTALMERYN